MTDRERRLESALRAVEWSAVVDGASGYCPNCGGESEHLDECDIAVALRPAPDAPAPSECPDPHCIGLHRVLVSDEIDGPQREEVHPCPARKATPPAPSSEAFTLADGTDVSFTTEELQRIFRDDDAPSSEALCSECMSRPCNCAPSSEAEAGDVEAMREALLDATEALESAAVDLRLLGGESALRRAMHARDRARAALAANAPAEEGE